VVKDHSLDSLLALDGVTYAIHGPFWVKFEVKQVSVTPEKPHYQDATTLVVDFWTEVDRILEPRSTEP
jgi:hypothetical protein